MTHQRELIDAFFRAVSKNRIIDHVFIRQLWQTRKLDSLHLYASKAVKGTRHMEHLY